MGQFNGLNAFFHLSFHSNTQVTRGLCLGGDRSSQWGIGGTRLSIKLIIHPGCCGRDQTPERMDVLRDTRHTVTSSPLPWRCNIQIMWSQSFLKANSYIWNVEQKYYKYEFTVNANLYPLASLISRLILYYPIITRQQLRFITVTALHHSIFHKVSFFIICPSTSSWVQATFRS